MADFAFQFEDGDWRVVIEDDGRVAYAYLFVNGKSSGLVWLYNRAAAPHATPEWKATLKGVPDEPPLNAAEKIREVAFELPSEKDFHVVWDHEFMEVAIYVRESLHAILKEGEYPGWCVLARGDGPLAGDLTAAMSSN